MKEVKENKDYSISLAKALEIKAHPEDYQLAFFFLIEQFIDVMV